MKSILRYILCCFLLLGHFSVAQNERVKKKTESKLEEKEAVFDIKGSVIERDSYKPISDVVIEINGAVYTKTDDSGKFNIQAREGDLLIVKHDGFQTVYYTIKDNQRITVEVEPELSKFNSRSVNKFSVKAFNSLIDSAETYKKKDAERGIQFILDALNVSRSQSQNAEAYEVSADIYMFWKQYDLAITNYKISLQNSETNDVKLKLAEAYRLDKKYDKSFGTYDDINVEDLSNWQKTEFYQGLGSTNFDINNFDVAIENFNDGLEIAKKHLITPKVTDFNSKIAEAYNAKGKKQEAKDYYSKSLNLATEENLQRGLEEKVKVADFENENQSYDDEIELRKEAINTIVGIETDSIINNESALTPQKQNYKIGNAYFLQKDYDNAIPYLEKSIEIADTREDLIVKKDATKKLSDVYESAGDYDKALETYRDYKDIVDELYIRKEQEISQAARFSRKLTENQNRITGLESERQLSLSKYEVTIERNKRQELIIYSLIGGLLLLLFSGYFMYKSIKQQKLANNLLALKSLRSQMNPHFIFNALNSVNSFIASNDERTANKYLSDFSLLMRSVLENSEEDFIPLEREIELIELYAKLEHFRFKDKFDYKVSVDESIEVEAFQIPPMLLQPYIENAVWHGLRYKKDKGELLIDINQHKDDELTITISDDGIGRKRSEEMKTMNQKKQNSKGMGNIKKRVAILNEMYKDRVDVSIEDFQDEEDVGTKVIVTLKKD
ncbi:histidine kinase [Winogradskyella sp. 3972H.M.0a.05]|uniref:histidine kinase n=1 Tax=Winogradskyella sp. 3972H.M.0a.05 TaxID=2950277 RepID=UPI003397FC0D